MDFHVPKEKQDTWETYCTFFCVLSNESSWPTWRCWNEALALFISCIVKGFFFFFLLGSWLVGSLSDTYICYVCALRCPSQRDLRQ